MALVDPYAGLVTPASAPAPVPAAPVPVPGVPLAAGPNYAGNIAGGESGGRANAENKFWPTARGGPLGPHQFIASTWQAFAKANPQFFQGMTPEQVLAARTNPQLSTAAANWYASYNAAHLKQRGIDPTPQNLAIAHALGGGGASSALKYTDDVPLAKIFAETQPGAAEAILRMNPQYQNMTLGDLKARYANVGAAPAMSAQAPPGNKPQPVASNNTPAPDLAGTLAQPTQVADAAPPPRRPPFALPGGDPLVAALNQVGPAFQGGSFV